MLRVLKSCFVAVLPVMSLLGGCTGSSTIVQRQEGIIREVFGSSMTNSTIQPVDGVSGGRATAHPIVSEVRDASGETVGYTVRMQVVSRSGPFTIFVVLGRDMCVRRAEVLEYRADRGRQVRSPEFTSQFAGKCAGDPVQPGNDIHAATGATLSSRAMAEGVRDALRTVKSILADSHGQ